MNQTLFCFAGNHREYLNFIKETGTQAEYISSIKRIFGISRGVVCFYGSWNVRRDAPIIINYLAAHDFIRREEIEYEHSQNNI